MEKDWGMSLKNVYALRVLLDAFIEEP